MAPRNPLEKKLAAIWTEVLRTEKVGVNDDFFQLGGHSLHVIMIRSRITEALQVKLPLSIPFEDSTIETLSKRIEQTPGFVKGVEG